MSDLITRLSAELDRREAKLHADEWTPSVDIADGLRLIEAHRKIVDRYRATELVIQEADGQRLRTTEAVVAGSKLIGQFEALRDVIAGLAEGYGLTTEEGL